MQTKISFVICFVLISFSPALFALGLGSAQVRSFLNQPLNARIELISQSQEELNTVIAGLASAADFEIIGLSRTVSVPLRFDVNTELTNAYVTVTSRLPISDPVVQLVVEVTWSGGRMLRQYNLFLDPPTFASRAPAPTLISRPAPQPATQREVKSTPVIAAPEKLNVVQARQKDPLPGVNENEVKANVVRAELAVTDSKNPTPGPQAANVSTEQVASEPTEALPRKTRQTVTVPADPVIQPTAQKQADQQVQEELPVEELPVEELPVEEVPVEEVPVEDAPDDSPRAEILVEESTSDPEELVPTASPPAESRQSATDAALAAPTPEPPIEPEPGVDEHSAPADSINAIIGPVRRGQTLWGIASDYSRGKGYSINQAMLAIQRLNPDAFGHNNINLLQRGAILRMPARNEVRRLSKRQAMLEAMRQETAHQAMRAGLPYDSSLPVIADVGIEKRVNNEDKRPATLDVNGGEDQGVLELVPPSEREETGISGTGSGSQPTGALSTQEVNEALARIEEELANAQQENTYLTERIRELETKIADNQTDGTVADRDLANMEASFRESRLSDEVEKPVVMMPPRDDKSWSAGKTGWLAVLLLLFVAVVLWFLKRSGSGGDHGPDPEKDVPDKPEGEKIQDIGNAAEEIPESLQTRSGETTQRDNVIDLEDYVESEALGESGHQEPAVEGEKPGKGKEPGACAADEEEAIELDSSDPEIKLDLARAYISMADHDAARQMLVEVLAVGNDAQVKEAQEMMGEL